VTYRALDLFCGAGGATKGLQLAGFHVTGVDIKPQPRYCGDAFHQADAMTFPLEGYDLIWASPPCQGYSIMRNLPWLKDREYPMLIPDVRRRLQESGALYIIENVNQARRTVKLLEGLQGGFLCGTMFGLPIYRHRRFETNFHWFAPAHPRHEDSISSGRYLKGRARDAAFSSWPGRRDGPTGIGTKASRTHKAAMGVDWMKSPEATQAIPPLYAKHIGEYAIMALTHAEEPGT